MSLTVGILLYIITTLFVGILMGRAMRNLGERDPKDRK
jgi:hypothetical protein